MDNRKRTFAPQSNNGHCAAYSITFVGTHRRRRHGFPTAHRKIGSRDYWMENRYPVLCCWSLRTRRQPHRKKINSRRCVSAAK
jgi:hypothetical protein